jgi:hypothetical protein
LVYLLGWPSWREVLIRVCLRGCLGWVSEIVVEAVGECQGRVLVLVAEE